MALRHLGCIVSFVQQLALRPLLVICALTSSVLLASEAPSSLAIETGGACSDATVSDDNAGSPPKVISDTRDPIYYPGDTERFKPLMTKLARNIVLDQKEIWTSPFHMNRHNAGLWLGFAAVTGALIATDRRTSHILENSKNQVSAGNLVSKTGATYTVIPAAAAFYLTGVLIDNEKARETGILSAEAMLDSVVVFSVLKVATSRNRPNAPSHPGNFFSGGGSFPSGHAITSWAFASVVAHEYPHSRVIPIAAYGLAALVTGSRLVARQHYASDLFAGSAMGWFIGTYVYHTHEEHLGHHHGLIARVMPELQPSTRTYAIGFNLARADAH